MSKRKIEKIICFIKDFLKTRHIKASKVVLFGSYAKKTFTKDSDVDIAIVSPNFEHKDIFKRVEMLRGLNWALVKKFQLPFDLVTVSSSEWKKASSLVVSFVKEVV